MPAPLLWLRHQNYFLFSKVLMNVLFSLISESLGGLLFHAHLSTAFFFLSVGFLGVTFLGACFLPVCFGLLVLMVVPRHSFFKELISVLIAMILSCSSVGLPQVFSSSRRHASYLFSAQTIRSSAMKVVLLLSHWLFRSSLIPLLQYVNRLGFEICSVNRMNNRTRKLGYVNLNWPRCSAWVTESLALTDGSFC